MATETITLPTTNHANTKIRVTLSRPKASRDVEPEVFLEPSMRTNHIEDFSQEEIAQAIDTVLKTSIYAGASRELMVNAIDDTVHGRMSLTQAAAKFGIPFSTIHPYVKKLRQRLGLAEPVPDLKKPRSSAKKRVVAKDVESDGGADGQTGSKKQRKKRSPPPGYVPFKQIIIPEHWKLFPEKMKDAVWTAVSFCNYDNVEKKQRLCQAILDVMIGQKTLKAAASNNNIPFTTLQTYFHRSRITMERCMETDEEVMKARPLDAESPTYNKDEISLDDQLALLSTLSQEQIFSMLMNTDASMEQIDALRTTASTPSTERSTGKSVDAVSDWLISKKMNENGEADGGSPGMQLNGEQTGSRKRKPQVVKRVNDGLNATATGNGKAAAQLSDFLEERFGLTMMKNEANGHSAQGDDGAESLEVVTLEKLHLPSVLNCEHKLAKSLVNYYVSHKSELRAKATPALLKSFEAAVIDVASNSPQVCTEITGSDFDTHLDIINELMATIPKKYAIFSFKILPDSSNLAQGKDLMCRKNKFFHSCLLTEPAKSLRELMTSYLRRQIVDYIETLASAGFPVTFELVRFLVNQVIKDRSLPGLYTSNEFEEQYGRITNSEKLKKFFQ